MWAGLLAWWGCATPAPPVEAEASQQPVAVDGVTWRLTGRVTPHHSDLPAVPSFTGGAALVARCAGLEPCAAEQWTNAAGDTRETLLRGDEVLDLRSGTRWPGSWRRLDGSLEACLRHPLFDPPAADLGARRVLTEGADGEHSWVLIFSGSGACELEGALRLDARGATVHVGELEVAGVPFAKGGRALLDERVRGAGSGESEAPLP